MCQILLVYGDEMVAGIIARLVESTCPNTQVTKIYRADDVPRKLRTRYDLLIVENELGRDCTGWKGIFPTPNDYISEDLVGLHIVRALRNGSMGAENRDTPVILLSTLLKSASYDVPNMHVLKMLFNPEQLTEIVHGVCVAEQSEVEVIRSK